MMMGSVAARIKFKSGAGVAAKEGVARLKTLTMGTANEKNEKGGTNTGVLAGRGIPEEGIGSPQAKARAALDSRENEEGEGGGSGGPSVAEQKTATSPLHDEATTSTNTSTSASSKGKRERTSSLKGLVPPGPSQQAGSSGAKTIIVEGKSRKDDRRSNASSTTASTHDRESLTRLAGLFQRAMRQQG